MMLPVITGAKPDGASMAGGLFLAPPDGQRILLPDLGIEQRVLAPATA
jgi:hypothetical protein